MALKRYFFGKAINDTVIVLFLTIYGLLCSLTAFNGIQLGDSWFLFAILDIIRIPLAFIMPAIIVSIALNPSCNQMESILYSLIAVMIPVAECNIDLAGIICSKWAAVHCLTTFIFSMFTIHLKGSRSKFTFSITHLFNLTALAAMIFYVTNSNRVHAETIEVEMPGRNIGLYGFCLLFGALFSAKYFFSEHVSVYLLFGMAIIIPLIVLASLSHYTIFAIFESFIIIVIMFFLNDNSFDSNL